MATKLVKELKVGDRIKIADPDGTAEITGREPSKLFHASGGCWRLDMSLTGGPHKGERIKDQHHPGDDAVELAEDAEVA